MLYRVLHSGRCFVDTCNAHIPKLHIFCQGHWDLVAEDLRRLIVAYYVPGQERQAHKITDIFRHACECARKRVIRLSREVQV